MSALEFLIWCGVALSALGLIGLLLRRNMLVMLMCLELMLNGANLVLVAASRMHLDLAGQVMAFVAIAVAAAEVGVGFGIILALFRRQDTLDVSRFKVMRG